MTAHVIPVIHHVDVERSMLNARRAFDAGCHGVLVIQMEGRNADIPDVARTIKDRWPDRLVGVNLLGEDPAAVLAASAEAGLDMTWTDEQPTHSGRAPWREAHYLAQGLATISGHILFAGVAFKHQRPEPDPVAAARRAVEMGMVPTTSGPATGVAADVGAIASLREGLGPEAPLAIASGITPGNAAAFAPHLTHILVATGVSRSFHDFDEALLADLMRAVDGSREPA